MSDQLDFFNATPEGLAPVCLSAQRRQDNDWTCADFFCGIGGFHVAARNLGLRVVVACDIDEHAQHAYHENYGLKPLGDIVAIDPNDVPDFDFLFGGFPCQPFSIIGQRRAFADPRGVMFFQLLKFIRAKRPIGVVLENVKQLSTIAKGQVLQRILDDISSLGYSVDSKVLNALHFGLPQKRERTIIVASLLPFRTFPWPVKVAARKPLSEILEANPPDKYFVSERIRRKRREAHTAKVTPAIWHENKGGNVSSHEWSCALRAGASHNYLLVDGIRRLTPREQLRLQGFPDDFKIVCSDAQTRKQAGNAVPVPMVQAVMERLVDHIETPEIAWQPFTPQPSIPTWPDSR
ncbi:MAG: DNA (cytosine-5-)-methyltransferase [Chloroflexi bacterium]|nr:DNA (cytosine-5-)-methyltransferase [Chloroflexota bacterium]